MTYQVIVSQEIREFHFKTPGGRRYCGLLRVAGRTVEVRHVPGARTGPSICRQTDLSASADYGEERGAS